MVDGTYARREFLRPAMEMWMTMVTRLRCDAALRSLPPEVSEGRRGRGRGRPRIYGAERISLAKRGGQRCGWSTGEFRLYGEVVTKRDKTFLATWRPAGA